MKKILNFQNNGTKEYIGTGLLAGVLAFAVSSAAVQYIDLDPWMMFSYTRIIIAVFFTLSLSILIFRNWKTFVFTAGILVLASAIIAIIWARGGFSEVFTTSVTDYLKWLWDFIANWKESMELPWKYSYITTTGVSALITIMMYFLIVKWFVYLPVFLISLSMFIAQWAIVREVNKPAFYLTITSLIVLYFMYVYNTRIRKLRKNGETHEFMPPRRLIMIGVPFVAVLMIIVMLVPKSSEPIKWKWLDSKIKYRDYGGDKPIDYKAYDQFSLAATGFSEEPGTPGGSVKLDFTHILDVYSDGIVYLRGESWPYFNGTSWSGSSETQNYSEPVLEYQAYNADRMMLLEPVYGWRFMNLNNWFIGDFVEFEGTKVLPGPEFDSIMGDHLLPDWYERMEVDIVYAGVETKSLFAPLYSTLTSFEGLSEVFAETDDTLETKRPVRLYTNVQYDYLALDEENEKLTEALRESRRGIYYQLYTGLSYIVNNAESFSNLMITNSILDAMEDLYDLYTVSEDYYWRYTAVSDTLPGRVGELAAEITEEYDNDYDKVKALEDYFQEDFIYSLIVEDVPAERDFVDWFLFGSKEGYCTYYATSMTAMVRSIGLPARYVEGFITPAGPEPGSRYPVLNSNAHAWVEVYFEGLGWIPFEPTPPYSDPGYAYDPNVEFNRPGDDTLDENLDELDKEEDDFVPLNPSGGGGKDGGMPLGLLIPIIILGALVLLNVSVRLGRKALFSNVTGKNSFKLGYLEILRLARIKGFKLKKGMTLMELAEQIDDSYFSAHVSMKNLTMIYYRAIYDDREIPREELGKIEIFYKDFRYEFNNELKLWEWFVYKILLPII